MFEEHTTPLPDDIFRLLRDFVHGYCGIYFDDGSKFLLEVPGWRIPAGMRWRTVFSPPTTSVWPALFPPWNRTTTSASCVSRSTIFPLPSSPHWAPTTTTFGMFWLSRADGPPPGVRAGARRAGAAP